MMNRIRTVLVGKQPLKHAVFNVFFLLMLLGSSGFCSAQEQDPRYRLCFYFGGHTVGQSNVQDVLDVNGYRSVTPSDRLPDSSSTVSDHSSVSVKSPGILLGGSRRWSQRMQSTLLFSVPVRTSDYFVNTGSAFPSRDNLFLQTSVWQSDLTFDYILLPYPRKKRIGFELSAGGGLSSCLFSEHLEFRLLDTALSVNDPPETFSFSSSRYGVSALFRFEAAIHLNRRFSLVPARLTWILPVLRPAFRPVDVENAVMRRSVSGRNYDLGGVFWYFGGVVSF